MIRGDGMEDKIFEFMEKMYSEINGQLKEINRKLDLKADKTDIVRLENDLKPKTELALEGYHDVSEKLTRIEDKLDNLAAKVESQDVQITVLKGGKQAAR